LLDAPPCSIDQLVLGKISEILQPPRIAVSLRNSSHFPLYLELSHGRQNWKKQHSPTKCAQLSDRTSPSRRDSYPGGEIRLRIVTTSAANSGDATSPSSTVFRDATSPSSTIDFQPQHERGKPRKHPSARSGSCAQGANVAVISHRAPQHDPNYPAGTAGVFPNTVQPIRNASAQAQGPYSTAFPMTPNQAAGARRLLGSDSAASSPEAAARLHQQYRQDFPMQSGGTSSYTSESRWQPQRPSTLDPGPTNSSQRTDPRSAMDEPSGEFQNDLDRYRRR
jgi:hypothetical protein